MASVFIFLTKLVLIFVILKTVDATLNCEMNETTGIILPTNQSQYSKVNCQSELSITNVAWYLLMLKGFSKPLEDRQWTAFNCTKGKSNVSDSIFCVHGPLDPPTISGEDNLVAGMTTNLTCTIYNVYPAPNIEWFLGPDEKNITMNASLHTTLDNSSSLFNATSSLSYTPQSQDHGQNLKCSALPSVANVWTPVNASIQLRVPSDSGQCNEILRVENATSSSLLISWVLKHDNITSRDITLGYCSNNTMDSENVTTSEDLTCPDYKEITVLNRTSYNLTGLEPFQWYNVTLLVGGNTVAWEINSTAPPLPEYYGVFMTFTRQKERLRITRIPIENRTLPSNLCFVVIQTRDQTIHNCSNGCCKPGSQFSIADITGYGLVSSGRGFYSLPSPPILLNSTRGILDMPHVTIVMGAVLGAAVFILLSSVALLIFLNFICKGIACLGKKGGYGEDDETLVRVIHKDNTRKVDEDGLVYVDIVHDHAHPDDAPPIRTEEPTVYASLDRNAMGSRKKDDDGLVYIEVSHDNAHSPDAPPIQTEKPIVYATLDMEAMATRKEKEEKGEEGGVKDEEDGVENEIGDVKEEKDGIKEDNEGVMGETDGVKEKKEDDKKAPEDPSPATTKQPNYENITLLSNDDGLAIPMETRL